MEQLAQGIEIAAVHPPLDDDPVLPVHQIEGPVPVAHHKRVQQAGIPLLRQLTQPPLPHGTLVRLAGDQQGGVDGAHFLSFLSHHCKIYLRRHESH